MELTEELIKAAQAELRKREEDKAQRYHDELVRKNAEAEERFLAKMDRAYPDIDRDTRYEIYTDYRNHFEW